MCVALGAEQWGGPLAPQERALLEQRHGAPDSASIAAVREAIAASDDPLGDSFAAIWPSAERRREGAFYTPHGLVDAIVRRVLEAQPTAAVDLGAGSGRFALGLRRAGFSGPILAIDRNPVATWISRANLAATVDGRTTVICGDALTTPLRRSDRTGPVAFLGNPPYVRHHDLAQETKARARQLAEELDVELSGLAGLHVLFLLAVARAARRGDLGCFVTAAEWLEVGYGAAMRTLLAGRLGLRRLDLLPDDAFVEAMVSTVVFDFRLGSRQAVKLSKRERVPRKLVGGISVSRPRLRSAKNWRSLFSATDGDRSSPRQSRSHGGERQPLVPLATYARVHRGIATGANGFFTFPTDDTQARSLSPFLLPCVSRALEVQRANGILEAHACGKLLLVVPDTTPPSSALRRHLRDGESRGIHLGFLCRQRTPWWRIKVTPPAPILVTYMARQPPHFATNPDGLPSLNVVHGIHFRADISIADRATVATRLVTWLNDHRDSIAEGRTYHGGLRKFEPRDLEAVLVPPLAALVDDGPQP